MRDGPPSARVRVVLLVLVLFAAGCTNLDADAPTTTSPTQPTASTRPLDVNHSAPPPTTKRILEVTVALSNRWVKPTETILATANVPVAWFVAPRNPDVPGQEGEAIHYVPRSLGLVGEGGASRDASMTLIGRYSYAVKDAPHAQFNVTVDADALRGGSTEVKFVRDAYGERFSPTELVVGRDTLVSVRNEVARTIEPIRVDQMARVAPDGATANITAPTLLGDYDVVALARDASDGWGQASVRLIVDTRRPDASVTFGPYSGRFTSAAPAPLGDAPQQIKLATNYNLTNVTVTFNATSQGPVPPGILVRIVVGGEKLGDAPAGASGTFVVARVPAGEWSLEVEPREGAVIDFFVSATAVQEFAPPESFFNS